MPSHHLRSDAAGPHGDDPDGCDHDGDDAHGRRAFLRRTAGVAAGAVGVGAVGVTTARAQEGTATGTGEDGQGASITTKGALPADAPTFENPDYTGMFVHVGGVNQNASTRNVGSCPFAGSDDAVVAYEATLIDRVAENHPGAGTLLFSEVRNDTVAYGKLFVVTGQQQCGGGHVQVQLEEVGEADVPAGGAGTGTGNATDDGVGRDVGTGSSSRLPGVGAAATGLFGGWGLLRRRR